MTQVYIKRVYQDPEPEDGYRVLVDRIWPRGMKKEYLKYDLWEKGITPSTALRKWFHEDIEEHWDRFVDLYRKELSGSDDMKSFIGRIRQYPAVTLLYASKEPIHNHAKILQEYIIKELKRPATEMQKLP